MKQEQTIIVTVDDFDHETPADTQYFEFGGTNYEIDLAEQNITALKDALDSFEQAAQRVYTFVQVAREVPAGDDDPEAYVQPEVEAEVEPEPAKPRRRRKSTRKDGRTTDTEIRNWARENGVEVNATGRVSKAAREQYDAAH